jgi:hypothetical protein
MYGLQHNESTFYKLYFTSFQLFFSLHKDALKSPGTKYNVRLSTPEQRKKRMVKEEVGQESKEREEIQEDRTMNRKLDRFNSDRIHDIAVSSGVS